MTSNADIARAMAENMAKAAVPLYGKKMRLPDRGAIIGIIKEFRRLLDLVYIGNWILNSTREKDRFEDYDILQEKLFALCARNGMSALISRWQGHIFPSQAYENGGIHEAIADYEDAVFEGGTSSKTGKPFTDYVTVESMVQCYLVNELSKNGDGFNTSAYLYKETGSEPMKMGPLWDYDLGFGNNNYEDLLPQPELLYTVYGSLGRALYALPEFRAEAQRQYTKYITPLADVLAGDADAVSADGSVHSFAWYREQVAAAAGYDELLWKSSHMDVRPGSSS